MLIGIEIQKSQSGVAHILSTHESRAEAESKYHSILASAAV